MNEALKILKQQAKAVQGERESVASEEASQWWNALLAVAEKSLAPVWQYAAKERPTTFSRQTSSQGFSIRIPGHREIVAVFHVLNSGQPFWVRGQFSGTTMDVQHGKSWWMVDTALGKQLPTYHQTLGSALAEAEQT